MPHDRVTALQHLWQMPVTAELPAGCRPGPRLVDGLEFLVGLLHGRHDLIPANFPWRFLHKDELREVEAAWLVRHPGWKTRIQKGPPQAADGAPAVVSGVCCSGGICTPVADAIAANGVGKVDAGSCLHTATGVVMPSAEAPAGPQ